MSIASTRRAALGAILAAPLTSMPAAAWTAETGSDLPDHEVQFLALIPQLRTLVPPIEHAKASARALYEHGDRSAGEHPGWGDPPAAKAWRLRAEAARDRNGYHEAWEAWAKLTDAVDKLVTDFMTERMTTLPAISWKARVADLLDCWEEQAGYDLAAWAREDALCA
ncbi:hypothetical protein MKK75_17995 [Methylobacterium sp. J-030]|uniref:hypothetical protein n=1 Tax=Methylobacterium sp. J-030 TaxID=2836627 RepID=UPI001FB9AE6F|nr:hypothetical protein [Methylobacterium sp. J-030]MCJ2070660.1 hypothetical protein [Methylobacterium sp. J-030]